MMLWMLRQSARIDKIANIVGRFGSLLILPLIFVIIFDVLTRKFQSFQLDIQDSFLHDYISPTKLQELEWHLHAVIFFLAYGMAYLANAHVRVDVLRDGFSRRKQAWIELLGLIFFAVPYLCVVLWFGWDFVCRSFLSGEGSDALTGIPNRWIVKSFLLIGLLMTLLVVLSVIAKLIAFLFGSPDICRQADSLLNVFSAEVHAEMCEGSGSAESPTEMKHDLDRKGSST